MSSHEVDDAVRELKKIPGFSAYLILNNDGIVIKYENMDAKTALHYAAQILSLTSKASKYIRDVFDTHTDNEVESIRLRTNEYEMIVAQHGNFTFVVTQLPAKKEDGLEEKKEGSEEKKEAM